MHKISLNKWIEPDFFAKTISNCYDKEVWAYLKSGQSFDVKNSKSIIALFPVEEIIDKDIDFLIKNKIHSDYSKDYQDSYLALLPYEYGNKIDSIYPKSEKFFINFPQSIFVKFSVIYEFLHDLKKVNIYYRDKNDLDEVNSYQNTNKISPKKPKISNINSNFSRQKYHDAIKIIQDKIIDGICYQSNLTRKFFGNFEEKPDQNTTFKLFLELSNQSPANYSCFIKYHEKFIISNSPELFIRSDKDSITSQPIKGTSPRSKNPIVDYFNKRYLSTSSKEKAENLMITDLVRNDLSLFSIPGSVIIDKLFKVDSYKSYHHLSTIVKSKLLENKDLSDVIKGSFPPASMTGTPKISAVNVAHNLEKIQRGIYSGAIGFINGRKNAILSVVIRTLIIENNRFEFQVGGAITIDSIIDKEIEETFVKARSICKILGIKNLENIV